MRRRVALWAVAAVVALGVGWRFAVPQEAKWAAGDRARAAGMRVLDPQPPPKQYVKWAGYKVRLSEAQRKKMATAGITSGSYRGSCDIVWRFPPGSDQGEIETMQVMGGGTRINIDSGLPSGGGLSFMIHGSAPGLPGAWDEAIVVSYADPYAEVRLHFTWQQDEAVLNVESSSQIIGEKANATHAKESIITETWSPQGQCTATLTGHGLTRTWTEDAGVMSWVFSGMLFDPDGWGYCGKYAVSFENIKFCGETVDLSAATARKWWDTPEGYYDGGVLSGLWLEGTADGTLGLWGPNYQAGDVTYTPWDGGTVNAPYVYDFSNIWIGWMDGREIPDTLKLYCTGLRKIVNGTVIDLPWSGTYGELKALAPYRQKYGLHSWDVQMADALSGVVLYIDRSSALAHHIEVGLPPPKYKVEGAGYGMTVVGEEIVPGPVDGYYSESGWTHNGAAVLENENGYKLFCTDEAAGDYGIGPGIGIAPYYVQEGGGPAGVYLTNTAVYTDTQDPITLLWLFGGAEEGLGPAVSTTTDANNATASSLTFGHDLRIVLDHHTLSATTRTESPYVSDIVSLDHDADKSIYANAHDHTDWVPDANCTAPDASGNFNVSAAPATLTLTLASNYIARQGLVGGVGQISVPEAYWCRRHDSQLGNGDPAETAEAVYDWRGWGYLKQVLARAADASFGTIGIEISFYDDTTGIGDNHKTGQDRQDEYTYSEGALQTLTRTIAVIAVYRDTDDFADLLFDLYHEHPLAIVVSVALTFSETGDWQLFSDPTLVADPGDRQEPADIIVTTAGTAAVNGRYRPYTATNERMAWRRGTKALWWMPTQRLWLLGAFADVGNEEATDGYYEGDGDFPDTATWTARAAGTNPVPVVTVGYRDASGGGTIKVFENYRYAQGGFSGHKDGLSRCALWYPDNEKGNVVELTAGFLNPFYGAETGEDLTTCFALGGPPITRGGDAWTLTYDSAAEESHFKDADDVWLKAPTCSDLMQVMAQNPGALAVAARCGQVNAVNGLRYNFYARHYVGGRGHGMLLKVEAPADFPRARGKRGVSIHRSTAPDDTVPFWEMVQDNASSDGNGHWESLGHAIYATPKSRPIWIYGVKHRSMAAVNELGIFATREYQEGEATWAAVGLCYIARDACGNPIWAACQKDGDVNAYALEGTDFWHCPGNPALTGAEYEHASICTCDDGSILVAATNAAAGRIDVRRSRNNGTTWEAINTAFGTGIVNGHLFHLHGQVYLTGWDDSDETVKMVTSSQADLTREVMDGTNDILDVVAYAVGEGEDIPLSSVVADDHGRMLVAVAGNGDTDFHSCRNFRNGFSVA